MKICPGKMSRHPLAKNEIHHSQKDHLLSEVLSEDIIGPKLKLLMAVEAIIEATSRLSRLR